MPTPNNPVQTFGVVAADVQNRVAGMSLAARAIGPDLSGVDRIIRDVAARVCGILQGQQIAIPVDPDGNEILWVNAASAIVAGAAARIVTSRNAGADPRIAASLMREHEDFLDLAITAAPRTGQPASSPGPQNVSLSKGTTRTGYTRIGGGL